MNVNLLRWIFINIRLFPVIGKLSILMDNIDVTDVLIDPVKMFEGDSLVLECMSDRNNVTISWNRNYFITINNSLAIKNVRLADAGTYVCTGTGSEEDKRLIGYDIGQDFAGVYACNVDNTGISVNKTVVSTYDTKTIHLKMAKTLAHGDVFSAAECKNYCRRNSSAFGNTGRYKNLTWDGTNIPDKNEKDLIIMITAGIGWAALTIALFINILCCVFKKRKKTDEEKESETQTDETLEMFGYTYARSLPETPSSYITEVRFPESIYLDINNCDMLSTGQIDDTNISPVESYQTISSESTFLKPIFTSIHTNNYLSTSRL